jgi:hypothetical protein
MALLSTTPTVLRKAQVGFLSFIGGPLSAIVVFLVYEAFQRAQLLGCQSAHVRASINRRVIGHRGLCRPHGNHKSTSPLKN